MLQPQLSIGNWETHGKDATTVRFAVFVAEQGVCAEHELDALDPQSLHAVIRIHHEPVATGRLCPDGRIGRMAVLAQFRNQGLGRSHSLIRQELKATRPLSFTRSAMPLAFMRNRGSLQQALSSMRKESPIGTCTRCSSLYPALQSLRDLPAGFCRASRLNRASSQPVE